MVTDHIIVQSMVTDYSFCREILHLVTRELQALVTDHNILENHNHWFLITLLLPTVTDSAILHYNHNNNKQLYL